MSGSSSGALMSQVCPGMPFGKQYESSAPLPVKWQAEGDVASSGEQGLDSMLILS